MHPNALLDLATELVRQVLKRGIRRVERPRYDGPFIDELIVSFRGGGT